MPSGCMFLMLLLLWEEVIKAYIPHSSNDGEEEISESGLIGRQIKY